MAKARAKPAKPAPVRPTLSAASPARYRVGTIQLDSALSTTLGTAAARLGDRTVLRDTAKGLFSGQLSLQGVLRAVVEGGREAMAAATAQTKRVATQQALSTRQLRADLLRLKTNGTPPRPGKDDVVVRGQVTLAGGEPAAGLVVEAIDRDISKHDLLGVALTDEKGTFQIVFPLKSFADSGEKEPEVVLVVGVEGQAPLHTTQPTRLAEGSKENTFSIVLPEGAAGLARLPAERLRTDIDARVLRVDYRQAVSRMQNEQVTQMVEAAQAGLAGLAGLLSPPAGPADTKPPRRGTKPPRRGKRT